jgi:hypothetical protein
MEGLTNAFGEKMTIVCLCGFEMKLVFINDTHGKIQCCNCSNNFTLRVRTKKKLSPE